MYLMEDKTGCKTEQLSECEEGQVEPCDKRQYVRTEKNNNKRREGGDTASVSVHLGSAAC